jgi:hypothetical protein
MTPSATSCIEGARDVGQLLKLKEWLTLADAARHLAILFGEEVGEADVLRLALDGHLTLSVHLVNHAEARTGRLVPFDEARLRTLPSFDGEAILTLAGLLIGDREVLELGNDVASIGGVWDLPMIGGEQLDVEHEYQRLTGGPAVELTNLEGAFVSHPDGTFCQLQSHFRDNEFFDNSKLRKPESDAANYYPAGALPNDAVFVVRTSSLQSLEARMTELDRPPEKPVGQRERTTLLVMIAALARMARIDVATPSSAAAVIESETTRMGTRVAARTIENHLNRIPDALESRAED